MSFRVPYTQQFSPKQTPLVKLLAILRQHKGNFAAMKTAIGSAFFSESATPQKIAGNTLASLGYHGILTQDATGTPTDFGNQLISYRKGDDALEALVKHFLLKLGGIHLVQTLREMYRADIKPDLTSIRDELRLRGFEASDNSSDLSGVLNWLREAGILNNYRVNEERYGKLVGSSPQTLDSLQNLDGPQIAFLRAMVALGISDWTPHNKLVLHAEQLYAGQVTYNWKDIDRSILQPLLKGGFVEFRKAPKTSAESRGGKSSEVKPTKKFEEEVAEPILAPLYQAAGAKNVRKIRSYPLAQLVADIRQSKDDNLRGEALEILAIRICQLLEGVMHFAGEFVILVGWQGSLIPVT